MLHRLWPRAFASPCAHACCSMQARGTSCCGCSQHPSIPRLLKLLTTILFHLKHSSSCAYPCVLSPVPANCHAMLCRFLGLACIFLTSWCDRQHLLYMNYDVVGGSAGGGSCAGVCSQESRLQASQGPGYPHHHGGPWHRPCPLQVLTFLHPAFGKTLMTTDTFGHSYVIWSLLQRCLLRDHA